jgi:integrase/recombinase XerD
VAWTPKVVKTVVDGDIHSLAVGHPLVDEYLAFLGARVRLNSWLAAAYDLKVFFSVIAKEPAEVRTVDVFSFIAEQRRPRRGATVVRLEDGEAGLAARTIKRRLSSLSGLLRLRGCP